VTISNDGFSGIKSTVNSIVDEPETQPNKENATEE
jgi:hypothetical protein